MFKSIAVSPLGQAERISIYLARISLIYYSFFHFVAVLLAEPSDLYTGSVWISVVSVKRFLGCLPKWRDSNEWASGLPVLAVSAIPGAWHMVPLLGRWSLARPFLWLCLGAALLVTVEASLSRGKGNSLLILVLAYFSSNGDKGRKAPELVSFGDGQVQDRTGLQLPQSFYRRFLASHIFLLPC